jgi:hypothetical protein
MCSIKGTPSFEPARAYKVAPCESQQGATLRKFFDSIWRDINLELHCIFSPDRQGIFSTTMLNKGGKIWT